MANLVLTDVAKSYGNVEVLKNINLDIETGELDCFRRPLGLRQVDPSSDDRRA